MQPPAGIFNNKTMLLIIFTTTVTCFVIKILSSLSKK